MNFSICRSGKPVRLRVTLTASDAWVVRSRAGAVPARRRGRAGRRRSGRFASSCRSFAPHDRRSSALPHSACFPVNLTVRARGSFRISAYPLLGPTRGARTRHAAEGHTARPATAAAPACTVSLYLLNSQAHEAMEEHALQLALLRACAAPGSSAEASGRNSPARARRGRARSPRAPLGPSEAPS